jgi:hypothetical protein
MDWVAVREAAAAARPAEQECRRLALRLRWAEAAAADGAWHRWAVESNGLEWQVEAEERAAAENRPG